MNKERYATPQMEIIHLDIEDVITASGFGHDEWDDQ